MVRQDPTCSLPFLFFCPFLFFSQVIDKGFIHLAAKLGFWRGRNQHPKVFWKNLLLEDSPYFYCLYRCLYAIHSDFTGL